MVLFSRHADNVTPVLYLLSCTDPFCGPCRHAHSVTPVIGILVIMPHGSKVTVLIVAPHGSPGTTSCRAQFPVCSREDRSDSVISNFLSCPVPSYHPLLTHITRKLEGDTRYTNRSPIHPSLHVQTGWLQSGFCGVKPGSAGYPHSHSFRGYRLRKSPIADCMHRIGSIQKGERW